MLDFFDVFNNNILKSNLFKISSDRLKDLDHIHNKLIYLIQYCRVCKIL